MSGRLRGELEKRDGKWLRDNYSKGEVVALAVGTRPRLESRVKDRTGFPYWPLGTGLQTPRTAC